MCLLIRRKCRIDRATSSRDLYVVKYNVRGYMAYLIKENVYLVIPIFRSTRESSNRFWRELLSSVVIWNLGRVSRDLDLRSRCEYIESTSLFRALRPIKKGKISLKRICRKLYSQLAAKERCKHLAIAVEEDVLRIGAQRRTREHLHSFVRLCIHFRRCSLYLEESFGKSPPGFASKKRPTLPNVSPCFFSSRFPEKSVCKLHFIRDEILVFDSIL